MSASMKLVRSKDYVDALVSDISKAKHSVVLFSHIIAYDSRTSSLIDALCEASLRGVKVDVAGDVFTLGILGGWKSTPLTPNKRIKALRDMMKKFKASGVQYRWIGQFGPFLFAGRTHVKWCLIDSVVYSFGGVNLYAKGLSVTDYMFRVKDKTLARRMRYEHQRIARSDRKGSFYKSHRFSSKAGAVLFDGGRVADSIIYKRACALAEEATDITFVSQYCPTGKLGKIMQEKNANLYFSHWKQADGLNRALIRSSMFFTGYKTLYPRSTFIHAKFIIFTMSDGSKIALTGSHNFVRGGVVLGTREVNLETDNPRTIRALEKFLKEDIL